MACADAKPNISSAYLKPGFAVGGSCLPKELRSLTLKDLDGRIAVIDLSA